ncbi:hypothetical protein SDC9_186135 [bioreactor metagenome]|uniref:Uncharacterized protein n=1 Tax=bioreactor metagenome TaxID=1076179 RepID=A0A645HHV7_9ZZZZ
MAKELFLQQTFGNCRAIDGHKRLLRAAAGKMERLGNKLLSRAAFPRDGYACIHILEFINHFVHLAYGGAFTHKGVVVGAQLAAQVVDACV